jgi:glutathione S-transferase
MPLPRFELVSHHLCPYVQRAAIVLAEKGVPFTRTDIDLSAKPDWFLALSPTGKVPLLRIDDTEVLFESTVIAEYVDEVTPGSLHPADPLAKAKNRAWMEFGSAILNDIAGLYGAADASAFEAKRAALAERFARVEEAIQGPWFDGERFGMVDAVFGPIFRYFDTIEPAVALGLFEPLPKVRAWHEALSRRPSVTGAVRADYGDRLMTFLKARRSHLSGLLEAAR